MSDINSVVLTGNLTRTPELRYTSGSGKAVCEFTLAVNDGWGDKQRTAYIGCVAWEGRAETIQRYCEKGSPLTVAGKLIQESWDDSRTGEKKSKTKVSVSDFKLPAKHEAGRQPQQPQRNYQQDNGSIPPPPPQPGHNEPDNDIPF